MKKLLLIAMTILMAGISQAGDWDEYKGTITGIGTTYQKFKTPEFVNGIAIYFDITSSPATARRDTAWITLWTKYQNVMGSDNVVPNIDSTTVIFSAKIDTGMTLILFDADSLQSGPNAKYRWGSQMQFKFVVRDSMNVADSLFPTPIRWRATIGGF
jgi:hypothetical protein